jgi:MFS family permease
MWMADPQPVEHAIDRFATRQRWAQWGVLLLLGCAAASAYLTRHCLAVANTTIQAEIGFNNEQFGYLYGAFSLGYLLCQIPGGWLGQKLGTRLALPLCGILWSLMTLVTAWVTTLPMLIAARFLFGVAQAGLVPNQAKVLQDWIPPQQRGTASAVLVVAMSVGAVTSFSLTSWLIDHLSWRTIFVAYAGIGIIWAVTFYAVFRATPAEISWLQSTIEEPATSSTTCAMNVTSKLSAMALLSNHNLWGLSGQALFKAAGYNILVTFLPAILEYAYQVPRDQTGALASWSLIGVIVGSMFGGWVIDLVQRRTGKKLYSRSGVGCVTLVLTALMMTAAGFMSDATSLTVLLTASSLFSGMAGAAPWVATIDIGGKNTAVVMGAMNSASALAGILVSPLVGKLVDFIKQTDGNWSLVIWLHAAFYGIAAISWLCVDPDKSLETTQNIRD